MTGPRRILRACLVLVLVAAASVLCGCSADLIDSLPLPYRAGTGANSYQITVHLADVGNLVPNAEVKVGDVTVGTITDIGFDNWTAKLTVSLPDSVVLPANAEAWIGQKSLLGAEYLSLGPPSAAKPIGTLRAGDDIPLSRTGRYPETEELLAALSAILNQGGVSQLHTITAELNAALDGHTNDARSLIQNVGALAATLDARKGDIVSALNNLNQLTATLARQNQVINTALQAIPGGLAVLDQQKNSLVQTLNSVSTFGDLATAVISEGGGDLHANLQAIQPILGELADSGHNLDEAMGILPTFPFGTNTAFPAVLNGDYGNLYITVDLNAQTLDDNLLRGLTIAGVPLLGGSSLAAGIVNSNPLTQGLAGLIPLPLGQNPGGSTAPPTSTPSPPSSSCGVLGWLLGGSCQGSG
ncbi:MAG TPA: MCE family protein [Pseudonocardiaceae bacterium]|nr:MCE family protein [Pseudonocardiaceae bacterium]